MQPLWRRVSQYFLGKSPTAQTLAENLYQATKEIHQNVERHPFLQSLFKGNLDPASYQQYLVDLKLVYSVLEEEIKAGLKNEPQLKQIYFPELNRSSALLVDLASPSFKAFPQHASQASFDYAEHLAKLGRQSPLLLAAHAYVRYLGDLSGGMILKRFVEKKWPDATHFYDFSSALKTYQLPDVNAFKSLYKERLNSLTLDAPTRKRLIQEAKLSFEYAAKIFDAISLESKNVH